MKSDKNTAIKSICPKCNKDVLKSDKFCIYCGNELPNSKLCRNCNKTILADDKFCIYCGADLANYIQCNVCGKFILKSDRYCIYCGSNVENICRCFRCGNSILKTDKYCIYCGNRNININEYKVLSQRATTNITDLSNNLVNKPNADDEQARFSNVDDDISKKETAKKSKSKYRKFIIPAIILLILASAVIFLATRKITIEYNAPIDVVNKNPSEYHFFDFRVYLSDVSKKGYTFNGWYIKDEEGNKKYFTALGVDLAFGDDLVLYADFERIEYKITYINGFASITNLNPDTYNIKSKITLSSLRHTGYIFNGWYDENGKLVTVIDGEKLSGDITLRAEWCKDYNGVYSYKTSTSNQSAIGYITIIADNVKVRNYPSTKTGSKVGLVHKDFTYDVYDTQYNDNYTWYEIGDSLWVPNNSSWVTYNGGSKDAIATILITADSIKIRSSASTANTAVGSVKKGDIYNVYNIVYNESCTWYRIENNKWIADNGGWVSLLQQNYNYNSATSYGMILVTIDELSLAEYPSIESEYYYEYSNGDIIYFNKDGNSLETYYADGYTWYKVSNVAYATNSNGNHIYSGDGWLPDLNGEWLKIIR